MSCTSSISTGFIDLATYDEIEKYLYGGEDALAYFVAATSKATWYTQVPTIQCISCGSPQFGQCFAANITRAGDYALYAWLRLTVSAVQLSAANKNLGYSLRWTRNFMHNLVKCCYISFNDLQAEQFGHYFLDFWAAFTIRSSKQTGYDNMIGNFSQMNNPPAQPLAIPEIGAYTLNLPLPLFFTRDSGVALPMAALPYNEVRIGFTFEDWNKLLILVNDNLAPLQCNQVPVLTDLVAAPTLSNVQVWTNYSIVSSEERSKMGCQARPILIEQVQIACPQQYLLATNSSPCFDIRFSHAVKLLFFAAENTTLDCERSNYTTMSPYLVAVGAPVVFIDQNFTFDPIASLNLTYENQCRLSMGSDYYSLIQPWYHAVAIPKIVGYHMYSYSLDFLAINPAGSTNYGKLTNVSVGPKGSTQGITAAQTGLFTANAGNQYAQTFKFVCLAVNNNIIRISGGALGFPVL